MRKPKTLKELVQRILEAVERISPRPYKSHYTAFRGKYGRRRRRATKG